jgi:hypothetical protein
MVDRCAQSDRVGLTFEQRAMLRSESTSISARCVSARCRSANSQDTHDAEMDKTPQGGCADVPSCLITHGVPLRVALRPIAPGVPFRVGALTHVAIRECEG